MTPDMPAAEFGVMPEEEVQKLPEPELVAVKDTSPVKPQVQEIQQEDVQKKEGRDFRQSAEKQEVKDQERDVLIRQILEEFMA